mmetsp:Transcript_89580/g.252496  ORF Transcript_89580/g.252496 Transcript_89580/m.252496 type:complete len:224 (-) Transcript_89580:229-900(-)
MWPVQDSSGVLLEQLREQKFQRACGVPSVSTTASSRSLSSSDSEGATPAAGRRTEAESRAAYPSGLVVRKTFLDVSEEASLDLPQFRRTMSAPIFLPSATAVHELPGTLIPGDADVELEAAMEARAGVLRRSNVPSIPRTPVASRDTKVLAKTARLGSSALPTVGSAGHNDGSCRPCAFVWKEPGCHNGVNCMFCHLCDPSEKKKRQKDKKAAIRAQQRMGGA